MKKFLSIILAVMLTIVACAALIGCGGGEKVNDNPNVLNVKIRKQGYGTTFITELSKKFEETFKEEGYKVNILPAETDLVSEKVLQDIYAGSKIDLFFSDKFSSSTLVEGQYGQVAADITDTVWNQKPISFSGEEESETVKDKLGKYFDITPMYHNDKVYGIPYAAPVGGLAVNTKVLSKYNLDIPRTTDEMFACAEVIMDNALSDEIFPFTYSFSDNMYVNRVAAPWIAQAGGYEEYEKFFTWDYPDGTHMETNAYEVYGYDGVRDMLEVVFHFYDYNMMSYGSDSHDVAAAQGQIMKGDALFYSVGDWMFQEEFVKYPNYRNDVLLIPAPMISSLGKKLFAEDYPDKYDKILSEICKYALEGKMADEIEQLVENALSVQLDSEDVLTVCERRGMVANDCKPGVIVNNNSTKKDIAAKFLRFIASTDAGKLFAKEAMTQSPYSLDSKIESEYQWFDGVNQMYSNPYFKQLKADTAGCYKTLCGISNYFPSLNYIFVIDVSKKNITKYDEYDLSLLPGVTDEVYRKAADDLCDWMVEDAKTKLQTVWKPIV